MIVGYGIAPHGALVLPDQKNSNFKCLMLNQAMNKLAADISVLNPDIIFLSTPHGIALERDFGFYLNRTAQGSAEWLGEYTEFTVDARLTIDHTQRLLDYIHKSRKGIQAQGISSFTPSLPINLRWGEVIPLYFMKERKINPEYVIMSQPTRRYTEAEQMISELEQLGQLIFEYFSGLDQRVFILISGDLAHTFDSCGPYGFSHDAEPFDQAIASWIKTMDKNFLFEQATALLDKAKCCGYTGFVLLQAMIQNQKGLRSKLYAIEHPSYYGMVVASFT